MTDQRYLDALATTYNDLDRWAGRARKNPPEQPERGSDLAGDDTIFPQYRVSEAARLSLVLAGEHIRLARTTIEAGQLYPSAQFTVLRGALVGAAQAVWMLSPGDRPTRQQRGLAVVAETYKQLLIYNGDADSDDPDQKLEIKAHRTWLETMQRELRAVQAGGVDLVQTKFIKAALEYTFPDLARRRDGLALWRSMSGDAHVLMWSMFQRATFGPALPGSKLSVGAASGSLYEIAQPFLCAHGILKCGWSLFDRRCEA